MGTDSDAPTATVYGNFKCPITQDFVFGNLEAIIEEFVVTGRLNLEFYNLTYDPGTTSSYFISDSDPRIASIGLAVWDEDPNSYWQFHHDTFVDAPSGYVDYDELASRVRSSDVSNVDALVDRAEDGAYDGEVEQIAATAAADGISYTPQMEFAGETVAPHHDTQSILNWIEARLEDAPAEPAEAEEPEDEDPAEPETESEEPEENVEEEEKEESDDAEDEETEESDTEAVDEQPDGESSESSADPDADQEPEDEGDQPDDESEAGDVDSEPDSEAESKDEESDDETDEESADATTDSDDTAEQSEESATITGKTEVDDCPF
ncbi:DsbA family protein [Natronococcus pandeyae]|nr:thioredoxin domain-containing protein [Natronococcus pandeyae]